ncbi:MAG: FMN reductase (NADPH) [Phototrophicales bacterium]|nr:MAG: FMN reductase (NADPH) [Phototrophicales bacterium]
MTVLVTIAGSPSAPSRTTALIDYAARYFVGKNWQISAINVRDLDPAELLHGQFNGASVQAAAAQIAAASGVIIGTPVYKAAYTGILKCLLDLLPVGALAGKTVLPFAIGGSAHHSLVIDYALKPVLAALGAEIILPGVYLIDQQIDHENGRELRFISPEAETKVNQALDMLADALRRTNTV